LKIHIADLHDASFYFPVFQATGLSCRHEKQKAIRQKTDGLFCQVGMPGLLTTFNQSDYN
jgi:hypothetical protein